MIHSFTYSSDYDPAMPVLELDIGVRRDKIEMTVSAVVDSGADATMIPLDYIKQLGVSSQEKRWLTGVTGGRYSVSMYTLFLQSGPFGLYLPVIGNPVNDEVIVGRDILNRLIVTLNGLAETVEISA